MLHTTTCVIIDDEPDSREIIRQMLGMYFTGVSVIAEATTIDEGVRCINQLRPELIFLDVQFPNGTAFDLLKRSTPNGAKIIFVTAYDHYAIQAIRYSAANYLLKPVDMDEFRSAVSSVLNTVNRSGNESLNFLLEDIIRKNSFSKLALPTQKGLQFVDIADIVYCEARDNYTVFCLRNEQRITVSKTLGEYESLLSPHQFFRVHHSYIVNTRFIREYIKGRGGYLMLDNGKNIDVSQNRKAGFLRLWAS
jgi:two-component system, LytTR family, response regulator